MQKKCSRDSVKALKITIRVCAVNAINVLSIRVITIARKSTALHFSGAPINEINILKEVICYLKITQSDDANEKFCKTYTETYTQNM